MDGRVSAVRLDNQFARQNRWAPFSLDVDGEMIRVKAAEPIDVIARAFAKTWTHAAARPRSFGGSAWAPDLVDERRPDWVIVRPGDYIEIQSSGLRWIVGPSEERDSAGAHVSDESAPGCSPYRSSAPEFVIEVGATDSEGRETLAFEVIHPLHDLAWRRRQVIRNATLVCRCAAGIATFSWISFAFEQLGLLAPMPWLLFALAVVLLMAVYAAHVASTQPIARTDPRPPPWQRDIPGSDARPPRAEVES